MVLLPNSVKSLKDASIDANKCYWQICAVENYFEQAELEDRKSTFKQNFGVSAYLALFFFLGVFVLVITFYQSDL